MRWWRSRPGDEPVWGVRIVVAIGVGTLTLAVASCGARGPDRDAARRHVEAARQLAQAGEIAAALARLDRARAADPKWFVPRLARADLLNTAGNVRAAREEALAASRLAPRERAVLLLLLELTPEYESPAETERIARRLLEVDPESAQGYYYLGRAILAQGDARRYPEAVTALRESVARAPNSALALVELGRAQRLLGDPAGAIRTMEGAIAILDRAPVRGAIDDAMLEEWLAQRRAAAFWLAQAAHEAGDRSLAARATADAERFARYAAELRAITNRAASLPPDLAAREQLRSVERRGLGYWEPR